jgi:thiamine biosynthesis lipoprotein
MKKIKLLLLVTLVLTLTACFPSNTSTETEVLLQGRTMGTTYNIKVVATETQLKAKDLQLKIDELLVKVNQSMSTYQTDSEISKFNQSVSTEPVTITSSFARVVKESIYLGNLTEGKLDVTVGPLVNLWGFGPDQRPEIVPTAEDLSLTKKRVGLHHLTLDGNQLSKKIPNLYLDLSTIAKGYAVDLVAELIEKNGFNHYLVEIGGEIKTRGFKHTGELWVMAIEKPIYDPLGESRSVHQIIIPKDNAIATSGDYRNYFEADGIRFSHIIDPSTGKPINHNLVSVTVIHPSSMTADGLSTALMVMGLEEGMVFAQKHDIAALFIYKTENGFGEQFTVKFKQFLK